MKKQKKIKNIKKQRMIFILIILIMLIGFISVLFNINDNDEDVILKEYYVCERETLWSIASSVNDNNIDVREIIYIIKKDNNLSNSSLKEGQVILLRSEYK
jgi:hypothetical protein